MLPTIVLILNFCCVALSYYKIAIQHNCKFAQFDLIRVIRDMQYFKAGRLVAVHGLKGELILKHELGKKSSLKDVKAIFIEDKKDSFFPWFIETAKARSADEVLLKLESIDTREAAAKISQKEIW